MVEQEENQEENQKEFAKAAQELVRLLEVMATLRGENGCPWDREQTQASLKRYLIEETYEAVEAIEGEDDGEICGELGDVLLQVVFLSQIAREENRFDFAAVAKGIADKMIFRHPHVFGDLATIKTADDVLDIWEILKAKEKTQKANGKPKSLAEVASTLPALLRAQRIQEKAARVGFDWPTDEGALDKLQEEILEVKNAKTAAEREEEFGDVLFSLVNLARFWDINAEEALTATSKKFLQRFAYIESMVNAQKAESGKDFQDYSLAELDFWWESAKNPANL